MFLYTNYGISLITSHYKYIFKSSSKIEYILFIHSIISISALSDIALDLVRISLIHFKIAVLIITVLKFI